MNSSCSTPSEVPESVDSSWTPSSSGRMIGVLVSLATRGAAAFYEHRGYVSKAGYYKKYFATDSPP